MHYRAASETNDQASLRTSRPTKPVTSLSSSNIVKTPDGEVFEHIEYTPKDAYASSKRSARPAYGETWIEKTADYTNMLPYRFTAKELDEETGLYYYGARYLNPRTSRWISSDPVGVELINPAQRGFSISGLNWYAYTSNNPVKYVDPTGLAEIYADDIHGNPILAWEGRDIKADTSVEIGRNPETGDSNDTMRINIGNQTLAEYNGVQSEKNFRVKEKQTREQSAEADLSDPSYPNATLPVGDDYKLTILNDKNSNYNNVLGITSDTVQIPGLKTKGIPLSFGFRMHSMSSKLTPRNKAYSWGCTIPTDKDFGSLTGILGGLGFKVGDSMNFSIKAGSRY